MVAPALVNEDWELGRRAADLLKKKGIKATDAFWLYFPQADEWRFAIGTPMVDSEGPLSAYKAIREALTDIGDQLPIWRVSALSPKSPVFLAVRRAFKLNPGARHVRSVVDDVAYDALVYSEN